MKPLWRTRPRDYWRYFPLWAWWFRFLSRFEKCRSCGERGGHDSGCYFA